MHYRKHNRIAQFYYEHVPNVIQKQNPYLSKNQRRRRFCVCPEIYQGQRRQYAGKCACVYGVCRVKNKIENETSLTDCASNPTQPNLNSPTPLNTITICTTENTMESRSSITNMFQTLPRSEIYIDLEIDAGVAFVSALQYIISIKNS
jgi:hypothetical protein